MKTIAAILLLPLPVVYAVIAFITWETSPAAWGPDGRVLAAVFYVMAVFASFGLHLENKA